MSQPATVDTVNRRIVLAARPRGLPTPENFRLEEAAVPTPGEGQVLLRTLHLSLDPYMRQLMDEVPPLYAPASVQVGEPMPGGTVNRVVESRNPRLRPGDLVLGNAGWQDYALSEGQDLMPLGDMAQPSLALGGSACRPSPPTSACSTSASPRPARRWWWPPRPARSARWSGRSPG